MSRRRLLGAVFAAPAVMALPVVAAPSPDAELVALCERWLALADADHDETMGRWRTGAPYDAAVIEAREAAADDILAEMEAMHPATITGIVALACVAVRRTDKRGEAPDEGEANDAEDFVWRLAATDPAFAARLAVVRAEREEAREAVLRRSEARDAERRAEAEKRKAEEAARPRTQAELVAAVQRWEVGLEGAAGYLAHCRAGLDAARIAAGIAS